MIKYIIKRDGTREVFDASKITKALYKAGKETSEFNKSDSVFLTSNVVYRLSQEYRLENQISVESVQDTVELVLLDSVYNKTAKAYILYREKRNMERKPDIFKPRINLKPFEYPHLIEYKEAIQHSYWLHSEFNYTSDIDDYRAGITDEQRSVIMKAMLAIAQVEVSVKTFWGDVYSRLPKPEIGSVGYTFADSEVRHMDAYSHLLEILGLNEEFEKIKDIPELMERVNYLNERISVSTVRDASEKRRYTMSIMLFSIFIEHVSLFSQFLIIMSFNKHKNLFKGISNVIEATSKEEQVHGLFGIELINIIRNENPDWFDKHFEDEVKDATLEAFEAESKVIDWIYEAGDLDFIPKDTVKEFIKNRLNNSLVSLGYSKAFEVNEELVKDTDWFDDEIIATKHVDFFVKRSIGYTKRSRSITSDDLF